MKLSHLFVFFFLVSCFFYNLQASELRLLLLIFWAASGFYLSLYPDARLSKTFVLISLTYIFYYLFSLLLKPSSLNFSIEGSKVEAYTVFLFPVFFGILSNYLKIEVNKVLTLAVWSIIFLLILDVTFRYMAEPNCFMNYQCRYYAKTVGLISTTNVTGACVVVLILSLLDKNFKFKKIALSILTFVLITTIARAAILAFLAVLGVRFFLKSKNFFLKVIITAFPLSILIFSITYFNLLYDGSFLTKIDFFINTQAIMLNADMFNLLFGFGSSFESIIDILGFQVWSPHIPFLKTFLYYGLIGLFLSLIPLFYMLFLERKFFYPFLAYFIISLAGAPIVFPALIGSFLILSSNSSNGQEKFDHRKLKNHELRGVTL
tara:strand:- start:560 stop:1687 length:1128 start_codon:yes stop_codon:yes gene_type:complete